MSRAAGVSIRIYRWADTPNELRRAVDPGKRLERDWLAQVPSHKRTDADGGFGWTDVVRVVQKDGSLLVAGNDRRFD